MKALITGGAGFIGSHLTKYLVNKGYEVIVLDNLLRGNKIEPEVFQKIRFVDGDVKDADLVYEISKGCHYIYHLAAILGVDIVADNPVETMDTEIIGTRNVVNAALKNNIKKVIYASTSGVYGHSAIEKSVDENIMIDPRTSYAMAKRYNEIYLKAVYEEKGLESVSLRYFNVYGARQDVRMVIPRFFSQALKGEPITVFGSGKQTRDFTSVEETIEATVRLGEMAKGAEVFNVANGTELTIYELGKYIKELTESSSDVKLIESPKKRYDYEVERRVGSSDKLHTVTNFRPDTDIKSGLSKLYEDCYKEALVK
ncbi:MAG: NAD-dependent dehydratase [Flavobacteriales bacterium]|nr:NAD-dependent dehydratase [Flavobacteriales bacterium]|tara:strand:- start:4494 stop:5432 length:939 start_codon:yes stop_codon:yes gene_type:complete